MKNAVTIDLEDYYQVTAFSQQAVIGQWDTYESRIEHNTAKLLSILGERGTRATFFTLGWTAQKYPNLIKEIAGHQHEIACHSNVHRSVCDLSSDEFREDTLQAKRLLEDVTGRPVYGYRAPSFSIKRNSLWAFEILAELGFTYDSSIFPIHHPSYGWPRAPRFPFAIKTASGPIVEFPMPTLQLGQKRAPIGGGAYLRLLPYWFTRWGLRHINDEEQQPACVYLHPWELDSEQPRMKGSISARLRHYFGLKGAEAKLRQILRDFDVQPLNSTLEEILSDGSRSPAEQKAIPEVGLGQLPAFLGEPN